MTSLSSWRGYANSEDVSPPKELVVGNEIQTEAIIVRIKRGNALPEIRLEEAAFLDVAMKPEQSGVKFMPVVSIADLIGQPNEGPFFVKVFGDRVRIGLPRIVIEFFLGQSPANWRSTGRGSHKICFPDGR